MKTKLISLPSGGLGWAFILCISLTSCDKRKDFYEGQNIAPVIEIRKQGTASFGTVLNDSIKKMFPRYSLDLKVTDEEKLSLNYSLQNSADKFVLSNNSGEFTPDTSILGTHSIVFSATDSYNVTATATANFTVFDNLPPVAQFVCTKQSIYDPLQYNIDASSSYDEDAKYGGQIVQYQFTINNSYTVTTAFSSINYIFPSTGNYTINVRVEDNNGAWSDEKQMVVNVN